VIEGLTDPSRENAPSSKTLNDARPPMLKALVITAASDWNAVWGGQG